MSWMIHKGVKAGRPNKLGKYSQLCRDCSNYLKCNWGKHLEPVDGWDAEPDTILNNNIMNTFKIYDCPEFKMCEGIIDE